jgi:hypothetical protein
MGGQKMVAVKAFPIDEDTAADFKKEVFLQRYG